MMKRSTGVVPPRFEIESRDRKSSMISTGLIGLHEQRLKDAVFLYGSLDCFLWTLALHCEILCLVLRKWGFSR